MEDVPENENTEDDLLNFVEQELQALQSIYLNEIEVKQENQKSTSVMIDLHPATADKLDEQYVRMTLKFLLNIEYPHAVPEISIHNPRGLSDEKINSIMEEMKSIAKKKIGHSMLFNIIEAAKEHLTAGNRPCGECAICLFGFTEEDVFTRTECYHYFHSHCLARYAKNNTGTSEPGDVAADTAVLDNELLCPMCRLPIRFEGSEDLFPAPCAGNEDAPDFRKDMSEIQTKMADLYRKQQEKGGIIDVEAEKNKFLIEISNVPAKVNTAADKSAPATEEEAGSSALDEAECSSSLSQRDASLPEETAPSVSERETKWERRPKSERYRRFPRSNARHLSFRNNRCDDARRELSDEESEVRPDAPSENGRRTDSREGYRRYRGYTRGRFKNTNPPANRYRRYPRGERRNSNADEQQELPPPGDVPAERNPQDSSTNDSIPVSDASASEEAQAQRVEEVPPQDRRFGRYPEGPRNANRRSANARYKEGAERRFERDDGRSQGRRFEKDEGRSQGRRFEKDEGRSQGRRFEKDEGRSQAPRNARGHYRAPHGDRDADSLKENGRSSRNGRFPNPNDDRNYRPPRGMRSYPRGGARGSPGERRDGVRNEPLTGRRSFDHVPNRRDPPPADAEQAAAADECAAAERDDSQRPMAENQRADPARSKRYSHRDTYRENGYRNQDRNRSQRHYQGGPRYHPERYHDPGRRKGTRPLEEETTPKAADKEASPGPSPVLPSKPLPPPPPGFSNPLKRVVYGLQAANPPPGFPRS